MKTNTQTIWQDLLSMPDYLPEKPFKALDDQCWLCGGEINGRGWGMKKAMGPMFTGHDAARASYSKSVCCSCAALTSRDAYQLACGQHGHSPYFPVKEGKKPAYANWMFFSHVFSTEEWIMPDRAGIREYLLNPPEPPFVITLAETGKKHVLFRAAVNHSRTHFMVQMDESPVLINVSEFTEILSVFERGYSMGFSKESLFKGIYNTRQIMKVGVSDWQEIEQMLASYRQKQPGMMRIAKFCSIKIE